MSSEAACALTLGVTFSLGGMMPGEAGGKAPGIESMAGVTTGGRPCGIGANGVAGGISILWGGNVNARLGNACSGASSTGFAGAGAGSATIFSGAGAFAASGAVFTDSVAGSDARATCLDTGPRLATIAAASAEIGDVSGFLGSSALGVEGPDLSLGNRGLLSAGDLFEGNVLLRCTLDVVGVAKAGVMGLGTAPEWRERFEEVETFLRTPLYLRRLSAPALEVVDADRPIPELLRPGVVGVFA
jgi:hypothetical protein